MREFTYELSVPAKEVFDALTERRKASNSSIKVTGDEKEGTINFNNQIKANYEFRGQTIIIQVTKKPIVLPWKVVETTLKGWANNIDEIVNKSS